jgi:predicted MFS family arabinose efflux permease
LFLPRGLPRDARDVRCLPVLTYYFQGVLGYSALKAGVAFLPFPLGVITSSTIASRTLPRFGPRVLASGGFTLATIGMLRLTQLPVDSAFLTHVVPSMLLISLGMGHVFVPLSSTALLGVPNHDAGAASALVNTMQQVGGASRAAVVHGFTSAFSVGAAIMALALLVVASLIRSPRRDRGAGSDVYDVEPSSLASAAA